jgi:hypothetical protein
VCILARFCDNSRYAEKIVVEGGLVRVLTAMDRHIDELGLQWNGCDVLSKLGANAELAAKIVAAGGVARMPWRK